MWKCVLTCMCVCYHYRSGGNTKRKTLCRMKDDETLCEIGRQNRQKIGRNTTRTRTMSKSQQEEKRRGRATEEEKQKVTEEKKVLFG